jgi:hypothetical protein
MDNENKEEVITNKKCKKKGSIIITILLCIITGFVVYLATNIGIKASKKINPDAECPTSNKESNTTSNAESNTTTTTISSTELEGIYEFNNEDKSTDVITLYKEGLFEQHVDIPVPGCPDMLFGHYMIEGNKITFYGTISYGCSCEGKKSIANFTGTISDKGITLDNKTLAKTDQKIESSYSDELDSIISCVYQGQIPRENEESAN